MAARKPDYDLVIQRIDPGAKYGTARKNKNRFQKVGVAWANSSGSFSITLNDGVVLDWRMMDTHKVRLYPNTPRKPGSEPDLHECTGC